MISGVGKAKRLNASQEEEFLLPAQSKIKSFIEDSKKKQTLHANCEGAYNRRVVEISDTDFLDRFISCTLFYEDECWSLNRDTEEQYVTTKIRNEMISTARKFNTPGEVHFSVIWVYYYDYIKLKEEAMPLFKVFKTRDSNEAIFLDVFLNKYDGWEYYLDNPTIVKSFICVPRNGTYVFQPGSESLDLIYVFANVSCWEMPTLPKKEKFMPFGEKIMRPVFSFLENAKSEVAFVVKKFVGFMVEISEFGKEIMHLVIFIIVLIHWNYKFCGKEILEDFFSRASNMFCMLLNKSLKLKPNLIRSGEMLLRCCDKKHIVNSFKNFFYELDYDGILSCLCLILKILPSGLSSETCVAINTISFIFEVIKIIKTKEKGVPALSFDDNGSLNPLAFENYQGVVDHIKVKIAEEVVANLKKTENISGLKILETAYEKADEAQSSGPKFKIGSASGFANPWCTLCLRQASSSKRKGF